MSLLLKHKLIELKTLKRIKCRKKRNKILKNASNDLIECIVQCAYNVLSGKVHLSAKDKNKLKPYSTVIRKLAEMRDVKPTRKLLIQRGGFLPSLIAPVLTVAATLLSNLITK